ncbi:MAG: ABC transporter permease [Bacteroidales bacterium]|nr:ABC transporter permease [Bacteroidales bacterium]
MAPELQRKKQYNSIILKQGGNFQTSMVKLIKHWLINSVQITRHNLKIIFGDKFPFFLLGAFAIFIFIVLINLFGGDPFTSESVYSLLVFEGIIIVFFPTIYAVQTDIDKRTIEILFGIPDYRYKVWLVRLLIAFIVCWVLLAVLALMCYFALVSFPVGTMIYYVIFPVFALGSLGFLIATLVKNGNSAAVVAIIIGLGLWVLSEALVDSQWNVFLNPFDEADMAGQIWEATIRKNRLFLFVAGVVFLVGGLLGLQNREGFMQ